MKSTPAVFCAPAMSCKSTPCISTPAVYQHESFPWAVKTPEASPMCWSLAPPPIFDVGGMPTQTPVISRELLRAVCQPFFEEMLSALQQTLHQQQQDVHMAQSMPIMPETMQGSECFQSVFGHLDPMLDDESTEDDERGAFASLLSDVSSEGEGMYMSLKHELEASSPSPASHNPSEDSEQTSEPEKSIMVCRHWKSKGFCRLESSCKFSHPENKCGISAPQGNNTKGCGMSRAVCPGMSTILSLSNAINTENESQATSVRRRKRGGRGRANRGYQDPCGNAQQDVA